MNMWRNELKHLTVEEFPTLDQKITTDVVVVGGGITGLLCALFLVRSGKKVVLIEKEKIASGATIDTTAMITKIIDTDLQDLIKIYGTTISRRVMEAGQKAVNEFAKLIDKEKIDCDFMFCNNYIFANTKKQFEQLTEEFKSYKKLKIDSEINTTKNIQNDKSNELNFPSFGYIKVPKQAKFDIAKFMVEMTKLLKKEGVKIFEKTEAIDIQGENQIIVKTKKGEVKTKDVIVATYQPFTNKKTHFKKGMYRTYVVEASIPINILEEAIYEDIDNPYHYFRVDKGEKEDRLIFGGEDHREEFGAITEQKSYNALKKYIEKIVPKNSFSIKQKWIGAILEPSDGLPLIGEIKPHYYIASAFSGNGMIYSMISAILLRDLINDGSNVWKKIFDPTRSLSVKSLAYKARDYTEEFFNGILKNLFSSN